MSSVYLGPPTIPPSQPLENAGKMGPKKVTPVSHRQGAASAGGSLSFSAILLILGIIFWTLGASNGNASMLLAGKVLVGCGIAPTLITLLCISFICCGALASK